MRKAKTEMVVLKKGQQDILLDYAELRKAALVLRAMNHKLRQRIIDLTGLPAIAPDDAGWFNQMFTARLPKVDEEVLKARLYDEYLVEVPLVKRLDENFIRVSIQGYNTREDVDRLLNALSELLPQLAQ